MLRTFDENGVDQRDLIEPQPQGAVTLRGCILCDIHDERGEWQLNSDGEMVWAGEWFGWVHDRANWGPPALATGDGPRARARAGRGRQPAGRTVGAVTGHGAR